VRRRKATGSETFYPGVVDDASSAWTDSGDVAVRYLGHERWGRSLPTVPRRAPSREGPVPLGRDDCTCCGEDSACSSVASGFFVALGAYWTQEIECASDSRIGVTFHKTFHILRWV
jgi:hypothetical protein